MSIDTIFTLDGRDHTFLDVLKGYFKLNEKDLYAAINGMADELVKVLSKKNIPYSELKNALVPLGDRKEIALFFDSTQIQSAWYSEKVFSALLPLLNRESCNSVLCGDYIDRNNLGDFLKSQFLANINPVRGIEYKPSELFYIVYLNNTSPHFIKLLNEALQEFTAYVGYCDLTYSSPLKTYLSTILVRAFVKYKNTIILPNEDNRDENILDYAFEENGYTCKGVDPILYGLFLSYKIEREVFKGFESDTTFSINAISDDVFDISTFKLILEEKKLTYLLKEKAKSLEMSGMINLPLKDIEFIIRSKLKNNYIYNLSLYPDTQTMKFNILVELNRVDSPLPIRLTVALEYIPKTKILRLITMF